MKYIYFLKKAKYNNNLSGTTFTHYLFQTLDGSQRCVHHQLRQTVHESLGLRPNK